MVTYAEFLGMILEQVSELAGDSYTVRIMQVRKNNGVMLDSLMISRPQDRVCPNIYLNSVYDLYRDGVEIQDIAGYIWEQYRKSAPEAFDPEILTDREFVRKNTVWRLINRFRNEEFLKGVPHKDFLDLSLVYYILVHSSKAGEGAVLIRSGHLHSLDLSEDELDRAARENTPLLLPPDVVNMSDMLRELQGKTAERSNGTADSAWSVCHDMENHAGESTQNHEDEGRLPMYVLTNTDRQFGACYMTDTKLLESVAQMEQDDLYILPSSIHECMIVPSRWENDAEGLGEMVREINRTQVAEEEFLSDCVYYYSRASGQVEIAS